MKPPKIGKITFALVDVKAGRKTLAKIVDSHKRRVPITLAGYITGTWSGDDGESIEFEMDVRRQRIKKPILHTCRCIRCEAKRIEPRKIGKLPALAAPYGSKAYQKVVASLHKVKESSSSDAAFALLLAHGGGAKSVRDLKPRKYAAVVKACDKALAAKQPKDRSDPEGGIPGRQL